MWKRNTPDKNEPSMECVKETHPVKKLNQYGMCKRNSPHKNEVSNTCVRETPHRKVNPTWDV